MPDGDKTYMALSGNSLVGLTHAARVMLENGRGEGLEDVRRVVDAIGSERPEHMSALMRATGWDAMDVAGMVRRGLLVVLDAAKPSACERCGRPPTRGTTLCGGCRSYLGWARLLGEDVPDAPTVVRATGGSSGGSTMHTRSRRD